MVQTGVIRTTNNLTLNSKKVIWSFSSAAMVAEFLLPYVDESSSIFKRFLDLGDDPETDIKIVCLLLLLLKIETENKRIFNVTFPRKREEFICP